MPLSSWSPLPVLAADGRWRWWQWLQASPVYEIRGWSDDSDGGMTLLEWTQLHSSHSSTGIDPLAWGHLPLQHTLLSSWTRVIQHQDHNQGHIRCWCGGDIGCFWHTIQPAYYILSSTLNWEVVCFTLVSISTPCNPPQVIFFKNDK